VWQAFTLALLEWWRRSWKTLAAFLVGMKVQHDVQVKQQRDALGRYVSSRANTDGLSRLEKLAWLRRRGLLRDDDADDRERE
jgi:hypothetical protein